MNMFELAPVQLQNRLEQIGINIDLSIPFFFFKEYSECQLSSYQAKALESTDSFFIDALISFSLVSPRQTADHDIVFLKKQDQPKLNI
jgi:hypothetical protein